MTFKVIDDPYNDLEGHDAVACMLPRLLLPFPIAV